MWPFCVCVRLFTIAHGFMALFVLGGLESGKERGPGLESVAPSQTARVQPPLLGLCVLEQAADRLCASHFPTASRGRLRARLLGREESRRQDRPSVRASAGCCPWLTPLRARTGRPLRSSPPVRACHSLVLLLRPPRRGTLLRPPRCHGPRSARPSCLRRAAPRLSNTFPAAWPRPPAGLCLSGLPPRAASSRLPPASREGAACCSVPSTGSLWLLLLVVA